MGCALMFELYDPGVLEKYAWDFENSIQFWYSGPVLRDPLFRSWDTRANGIKIERCIHPKTLKDTSSNGPEAKPRHA